MKKRLLVSFLVLALSAPAFSDMLLDTGPPNLMAGGYSFSPSQSLAILFTLDDERYITAMQGYMDPAYAGDLITLTLYGALWNELGSFDAGTDIYDVNTAETFYSGSFTFGTGDTARGWYGLEGIPALRLDPGNYWLAFQITPLDPQTYGTTMYDGAVPGQFSFTYTQGGPWTKGLLTDPVFAARITGDVIPEPGTILLLGMGLLALTPARRRRAR